MDEQEMKQLQARIHGDVRHALSNNEGSVMDMELSVEDWQAILAALEIAAEL